jgi:hypothetical protein
MKTKNLQYLLIVFICVPFEIQAQYTGPFIIKNKDGYIQKSPNENSKTKTYKQKDKYQLLFLDLEPEYDDEGNEIIKNYADSTWIPVFNDKIVGYVHKENLLPIDELPYLDLKTNINKSAATEIITRMNDSIIVSMEIVPVDTIAYICDLKRNLDRCYGDPDDECSCPAKKLSRMIIDYKGKKTILDRNRFKNYYYEIRGMGVSVGKDGELYIVIVGAGDAAEYAAWIIVMNENILFEFIDPNNTW